MISLNLSHRRMLIEKWQITDSKELNRIEDLTAYRQQLLDERRILKKDPDFPIEYAKRIIGLRNQIIHAYDNISDENIWAIITKHIPNLKEEVLRFIKNSE